MRALMLSIAFAAALSAPSVALAPETPDWMSGYWLSCENGEQVAENWFGAGSGMLLGANLTQTSRGTSFEMLRIGASAAGVSYFAQPGGRPPTEFAMSAQEPRRIVFENLAHDFPQRILYWREGNVLHARTEGTINGRAASEEWTMRRVRADAACRR